MHFLNVSMKHWQVSSSRKVLDILFYYCTIILALYKITKNIFFMNIYSSKLSIYKIYQVGFNVFLKFIKIDDTIFQKLKLIKVIKQTKRINNRRKYYDKYLHIYLRYKRILYFPLILFIKSFLSNTFRMLFKNNRTYEMLVVCL